MTAEKKTLEERHSDCTPLSDLTLQLKERDEKHAAELKKERDEVAWLKEQIEAMKASHESEVERIRVEERDRHDAELRKCKELLNSAKKTAASTSEALTNLQEAAKDWQLVLTKLDAELASK